MPDRGHTISAIRLSELERERGNLTKDEFDRINRKAHTILKKTKKNKKREEDDEEEEEVRADGSGRREDDARPLTRRATLQLRQRAEKPGDERALCR